MKRTASLITGVFLLIFNSFSSILILGTAPIAHALADTCTWTGGGSDDNFSTAANWTGCDNGTVPESGDILEFDVSLLSGDTFANNDLTSLNIAGINVTGTAAAFPSLEITGNPITLSGNITGDNTGGDIFVAVDVTLGSNVTYSLPEFGLDFYSSGSTPNFDVQSNTFTVAATSSDSCYALYLGASLTGSGQIITNSGAAYVILGESASSFTGSIVSNGSGVIASKGDALSAGASVTINGSGKLVLEQANSLPTQNYLFDVTMNSTANPSLVADSTAFTCPGGPSTLSGSSTLSGDLTLQSDTVFFGAHNLNVTGTYTANSHALSVKSGSGGSITTPSGTVEPVAQTVTIASGDSSSATEEVGNKVTLILNGSRGVVNVRNGGILKGSGSADGIVVYSGGTMSPGQSPGCMTIGTGSGVLSINGAYDVEIAGTTACSGYDQSIVNGTVDVSGGSLNVSLLNSFVPALNNTFTIISNDGSDAVTGTFTGLTQGANIVVNGVTFTISYTGGDGNDVVLTVAGVPSSAGAPNSGVPTLTRNAGFVLGVAGVAAIMLLSSRKLSAKRIKK